MEIPINWSFKYSVEYICMKRSHSVCVGIHQYNFDSGRQNERTEYSKYLSSDGINIKFMTDRHTDGQTEKVRVI